MARRKASLLSWVTCEARYVLCRLHSHCVSAHIFKQHRCDCREQMELAQLNIEQQGAGVIIWLDQEV